MKNILEKCLNTGTSNPDSCWRHFCMFTNENEGVLLKEVEVLGLDHIDELDDDFKVQKVNKLFWVWKMTEQQDMMAYQLGMEDVGYHRWRSWNFIEIV